MSLDIDLVVTKSTSVFWANYTHNVIGMAKLAGIYQAIWRPEEIGITVAGQLIKPLRDGIEKMESCPDKFKALNPENGWGSYDTFLPWIKKYLAACEDNPEATIEISR